MIKELTKRGIQLRQEAKAQEELTKLGTLRGGNSGCILEDGSVIGKCHRISMLRSIGLQESKEYNVILLFDGGFANEDAHLVDLRAAWDGSIKCEEEIPIIWETSNGTKVTGRPDTVLLKGEDPVYGIEHKQIVSMWSARDKVLKDQPGTDHMVQAAHYSWKLDIPFSLFYTNRSKYHIPYTRGDWFKREALENVEKFGEDFIELKAPDFPFAFKPFMKEFLLEWRNGRLWYKGDSDWIETEITTVGIKLYYEKTSQMHTTKTLGPMLSDLDLCGNKAKNLCQYCPLHQECLNQETDYNFDRFIETAKQLFTKE